MNLLIIGATGRTGRPLTEQALERGHCVTAMIRGPGSLNRHQNLQIVVGDPSRYDDLARVLPGHDVVISCLGQRSRADASLLRNASAAMLDAMARSGVRRYLVVSQGLLFPSWNPIIALLRMILARHVADSIAMERLVCASDVDWTIVRPPRLLEGGARRGYRVKVGAAPGGAWAMQRADLAEFLLDESQKQEYVRAIVGVTSA
jgi:putative NADH-flavin reductase